MLGNLGTNYKEEELKAIAAAEAAALANINPDGGYRNYPSNYAYTERQAFVKNREYQDEVRAAKQFNRRVGQANQLLGTVVGGVAKVTDTEMALQGVGQVYDATIGQQFRNLTQFMIDRGMDANKAKVLTTATEAGVDMAIGSKGTSRAVKSAAKGALNIGKKAAFQYLSKTAPVVHAMGKGKGKLPAGQVKLTDIAISHRITPEGVKNVYGTTKKGPGGTRQRVLGSDAHAGMISPIFHHIIGKKIRFRFQQKMEQLDPKGGKSRLEALDKKYNLQAGSGDDAGLTMDQQAHGPHHDASRLGGVEPWDTKKDKTLSKLKKLIDNATSTEDLEFLYEEYLKYSVIPDLDHAIRYQRGFEILGSPKGGVDKTLLKETAHEWGDRMQDIGSVKDDIYWDDVHKAAIEEARMYDNNRYTAD